MANEFWQVIKDQCKELESAKNEEDVLRILSKERNPYHHDTIAGDGFFAGGGGDESVEDSLDTAGWTHVWRDAWYYWAMRAPDGSIITYVEGDIYKGDQKAR